MKTCIKFLLIKNANLEGLVENLFNQREKSTHQFEFAKKTVYLLNGCYDHFTQYVQFRGRILDFLETNILRSLFNRSNLTFEEQSWLHTQFLNLFYVQKRPVETKEPTYKFDLKIHGYLTKNMIEAKKGDKDNLI